MSENSAISWTDHTFNPWMGCTKVSPACAHCYAERDMDKRYGKVAWGVSGTRVLTSHANWAKPAKWNREAGEKGIRYRVFCASLADVFEDWKGPMLSNGVPVTISDEGSWLRNPDCPFGHRQMTMDDARNRLFDVIDATPNLDWLLLTKRPENIRKMWPKVGFPDAGIPGSLGRHVRLNNVWLGTTVENQEYANKRIPELLRCRDLSPVLFLSCEPLLGHVDITQSPHPGMATISEIEHWEQNRIDWVIAGGESGPNARPSHPDWFRSLRDQCKAANVPFHFKQWGEWIPFSHGGRNGAMHEWNDADYSVNVGTKHAGRLLDGVLHDAFPEVQA